MEYALLRRHKENMYALQTGLNPCSNGICSLTMTRSGNVITARCLNPCSNGICSLTVSKTHDMIRKIAVLILVLMEYALLHERKRIKPSYLSCLNPCSNGICSLTNNKTTIEPAFSVLILVLMEYALLLKLNKQSEKLNKVLILVLMEYALLRQKDSRSSTGKARLNPCSNGICSLTG